jgi:hypothetical protein
LACFSTPVALTTDKTQRTASRDDGRHLIPDAPPPLTGLPPGEPRAAAKLRAQARLSLSRSASLELTDRPHGAWPVTRDVPVFREGRGGRRNSASSPGRDGLHPWETMALKVRALRLQAFCLYGLLRQLTARLRQFRAVQKSAAIWGTPVVILTSA